MTLAIARVFPFYFRENICMNIDRTLGHIDALRDMLAYKQETMLKYALKEFWAKYGSGVNAIFWEIKIPEDPMDMDEPDVPIVYDIHLGSGNPIRSEAETQGMSLLSGLSGISGEQVVLHSGTDRSCLFYSPFEWGKGYGNIELKQPIMQFAPSLQGDTSALNSIFNACSEYLISLCGVSVVCMATPLEITWRTV